MPRKSTRSSPRTQQKVSSLTVALTKEDDVIDVKDSLEVSKDVRRSPRIQRGPRAHLSNADRVTRSRTRVSGNESPVLKQDEDLDDSFDSDKAVTPRRSRKRTVASRRRKSAKKKTTTPSRRQNKKPSIASRGKQGRRHRKRESDEDDSDESELDLGETDEEDEEQDEEEDDNFDIPKTVVKSANRAERASRRSFRGSEEEEDKPKTTLKSANRAERASRRSCRGSEGLAVLPANSRSSPSVLLERMDQPAPGHPTRVRSSTRLKDEEVGAVVAQRRGRRGRRGASVDHDNEELATESLKEATLPQAIASHKQGSVTEEHKNVKDTGAVSESEKEASGSVTVNVDACLPKQTSVESEIEEADAIKNGSDVLEDDEPPSKKCKTATSPVESNVADVTPVISGEAVADVLDKRAPLFNDLQPDDSIVKDGQPPTPLLQTSVNGDHDVRELAVDAGQSHSTNSLVELAGNDEECSKEIMSASLGLKLSRRCVYHSDHVSESFSSSACFSIVSYNLVAGEWADKHQSFLDEMAMLNPSILCLQNVDEGYFKSLLDSALKSHGYMGLFKSGKTPHLGIATFYLLTSFEILHHSEFEVHELLAKEIDSVSVSDGERQTLKQSLHCVAPVLVTKLRGVSSRKCLTVGNVHVPGGGRDAVLALQAAAVFREVLSVGDGAENPHVVCGSLNLTKGTTALQLLQHGHVERQTLDELKGSAKGDISNEQQNVLLLSLLDKNFIPYSPSLKNCYESVLGHELFVHNLKESISSVWFSGDSLFARSVLDAKIPTEEVLPVSHVSLKVDLSFRQ